MKDAKVVFDDFSGGDYGRDWAGMDADDKFRAINIIEYPGGWIGPRAPVFRLEIPAGETADPDEEDPPIVGDLQTADRAIWFIDNNLAITSDGYAWNLDTGQRSWTQIADVTKVPDYFVTTFGFLWCNTLDYSAQPDFVVRVFSGNSYTATAPVIDLFEDPSPVAGSLRADRYNDTVIYSAFRTFRWSDGLVFDDTGDWPAGNTSDVYTRAIYDIIEQKNTLVLVTGSFQTGSALDGSVFATGKFRPLADVYVVYGALGADATLRKVDSGPEPIHTDTGAYLWTTAGDDTFWVNTTNLMRFDGAEVVSLPAPLPRIHPDTRFDIGPDAVVSYWTAAPVVRQGSQILAGALAPTKTLEDSEHLTLRKGVFVWSNQRGGEVWTAHDPGITYHAEEATPSFGLDYTGAGLAKRGNSNFYVYQNNSNLMVFATGGNSAGDFAEPPKFYAMLTDPQFPSLKLNDGDTGKPVTADFYTHDYWDPQGREIYVENIEIDYAYMPGDSLAAHNTLTASVEVLQLNNDQRPRASAGVTFSPDTGTGAPSEPGTEIIRGRATLPVRSEGSGNGFRIHLSNWSGITVRRIKVNVRFTEVR